MRNVVVLYDSVTGNTAKIAGAIVNGLKKSGNVNVLLKKVNEKFPLRILNDADLIVFGSPARYANVTPDMHTLLTAILEAIELGILNLKGKSFVFFGSYGWDGGIALERVFNKYAKLMGLKVLMPGFFVTETPSENDLKLAEEFGLKLASLLK
jgi:flavorubredoxin